MTQILRSIVRVVMASCSLAIAVGIAEASDADNRDELLVLIPVDNSRDVQFMQGIRVYHRLPQYYIAGTSRGGYERFVRADSRTVLLDENPWYSRYAIVSLHPGSSRLGDLFAFHVLANVDDIYIVRGTRAEFSILREKGFSCVEIAQETIPVSSTTTHLSRASVGGPHDSILRIISAVSDSTITSTIQGLQNFGTRYAYNANRDSVFRWVRQRFIDAGVTDVVLDSFQYNGTWQKNVIATIPGSMNPTAEIIVGGHLDSYSSNLLQAPGADDNASGTTAAIEMARVLVQSGYNPTMTLRFIGFAAEELGLIGSADYAAKARAQNRNIKVMMNYDMIGYRNQTQSDRDVYIVWYPGSEAFSALHSTAASLYTPITPVLTSQYRSGSDSWSFYQQSYNTVFAIERDFSPYYHSPNDLLQYLDIPYAREVIKAGLAMVLTLDALPPGVSNLSINDCGNGTSLFVQWDSVSVPDWYRYKVYVGTEPGVYTSSSLRTTHSATLTGLTTGTPYYVGVSTVDLAGNESPILEQSETPLLVPRPPQGIAAEGIVNGVRVTWESSGELDFRGYRVYRSWNSDSAFILLTGEPIRDPAWTDTLFTSVTCYYCVTAVDSAGFASSPSDTVSGSPIVGVTESEKGSRPASVTLHENYPNPFNPSTTIRFAIPEASHVTLRVFDGLGRMVSTLVDEMRAAGEHSVRWDARGQASGTYYVVLQAGAYLRTHRVMFLK